MTRLFVFWMIILLSVSAFSADKQTNQTSTLTALEVKDVTRNIVVALNDIYLYPEKAQYIATTLQSESYLANNKDYDIDQFRKTMTTKIVRSTFDTSIELLEESPKFKAINNSDLVSQNKNSSVTTEISENNIGYLKVTGNSDFDGAEQLLTNSVTTLSGVEALIIDIRWAEQINLSLTQELVSYFFPNGAVLGKLTSNKGIDHLISQHIDEYKKVNDTVPLYILTSSFVSKEWEFFTYVLQQLKKATVVGERTMGIAQLKKSVKVGNNIALTLPYALITHPETDENWQETGVIPDHDTSKQKALKKAYQLALAKLNQ